MLNYYDPAEAVADSAMVVTLQTVSRLLRLSEHEGY